MVGAGIGGLTAAIALRRAGLPVEVYERAPELLEVGAGLTLQPNALLALRAIGLEDAVRLAGHAQAAGRLLRSDGRVLAELPVQDVYRAVGAIAVGIHRGTLQSLLLDALVPVTPRCGRAAVRYEEESDRVTVHFAEGGSATGALLLGADGLRSAVRAQLLADGEPVYRGYTAWRGVAPPGAALLAAGAESWGCGRRFGMVPIDGGRAYWYAAVNAPPGGTETSRAVLRGLFAGWHAPVHTLVEATPEEAILRGDVFDRPPSSFWGRGRVTLLGDAAHPMTPNLGQGACQAIEDAVVLARCLAERCDAGALRRYRRPAPAAGEPGRRQRAPTRRDRAVGGEAPLPPARRRVRRGPRVFDAALAHRVLDVRGLNLLLTSPGGVARVAHLLGTGPHRHCPQRAPITLAASGTSRPSAPFLSPEGEEAWRTGIWRSSSS